MHIVERSAWNKKFSRKRLKTSLNEMKNNSQQIIWKVIASYIILNLWGLNWRNEPAIYKKEALPKSFLPCVDALTFE